MSLETTFAMRRAISAYALFLPLSPWRTDADDTPPSKMHSSTSTDAPRGCVPRTSVTGFSLASVLLEAALALLYMCFLVAILHPSVLDVAWYWAASYCLMMILAARSTMALASWLVCPEARVLRARATRTLRRTSLRYISQNSWHSSLLLALASRLLTWMPLRSPTGDTSACASKTPSLCAVPMCDSSFESL